MVKTKKDWAEIVAKDKLDMDIEFTDEEISEMKESKFKTIVNKAVSLKALQSLNTTADSHSKSKILVKSELAREKYFDDKRFSRSEVEGLE